jgi:hypothetical protein
MRLRRGSVVFVCGVIGFAAINAIYPAAAQLGLPPYDRAPPSVLSGHPYHPEFCSLFHRGPCFPNYLPPIGQDLRLTIVSSDANDPANKSAGDANDSNKDGGDGDTAPDDKPLDSIGAMYAALRACWVPPPKDEARHGMEYTVRFAFKRSGEMVAPPRVTYSTHGAPPDVRDTYRDAVDAALARCMPLHFSDGMAGAVAGRPIAIRYVDERTLDKSKSPQ